MPDHLHPLSAKDNKPIEINFIFVYPLLCRGAKNRNIHLKELLR